MEDISKTTVAVLLILVVLISVIGTWVVFSSFIDINQQQSVGNTETKSGGNVILNVLNKQQTGSSTTTSGNVVLTVLKPEDKEGG